MFSNKLWFCSILLLFFSNNAFALMGSTNFDINALSFVAGGESNSTNYTLSALTFGETLDGNQSSANFWAYYGFNLASVIGFPIVDINSPTMNVVNPFGTTYSPVTLVWSVSPRGVDVKHFWVSRGGNEWIDAGDITSYTFEDQTDGTYQYYVRSVNWNDVNTSEDSIILTISQEPEISGGGSAQGGGSGGGGGGGAGFVVGSPTRLFDGNLDRNAFVELGSTPEEVAASGIDLRGVPLEIILVLLAILLIAGVALSQRKQKTFEVVS